MQGPDDTRPPRGGRAASPAATWRRPTLRRYGPVRGATDGTDLANTDGIDNLS